MGGGRGGGGGREGAKEVERVSDRKRKKIGRDLYRFTLDKICSCNKSENEEGSANASGGCEA